MEDFESELLLVCLQLQICSENLFYFTRICNTHFYWLSMNCWLWTHGEDCYNDWYDYVFVYSYVDLCVRTVGPNNGDTEMYFEHGEAREARSHFKHWSGEVAPSFSEYHTVLKNGSSESIILEQQDNWWWFVSNKWKKKMCVAVNMECRIKLKTEKNGKYMLYYPDLFCRKRRACRIKLVECGARRGLIENIYLENAS